MGAEESEAGTQTPDFSGSPPPPPPPPAPPTPPGASTRLLSGSQTSWPPTHELTHISAASFIPSSVQRLLPESWEYPGCRGGEGPGMNLAGPRGLADGGLHTRQSSRCQARSRHLGVCMGRAPAASATSSTESSCSPASTKDVQEKRAGTVFMSSFLQTPKPLIC